MQDDSFEWDDVKSKANLKKHKVSFEVARGAFDDPVAIVNLDTREDYGEDRMNWTGMVGSGLLTVTYVERDRIRIISARKANRDEQDEYNDNQG